MSYQNVGTPRFYINDFLWGASAGITKISPLIDGNPISWTSYDIPADSNLSIVSDPIMRPDYDRPNYFAVLRHNMGSYNCGIRLNYLGADTEEDPWWQGGHTGVEGIVNFGNADSSSMEDSGYSFPEFNGFSIAKMTDASDNDHYNRLHINLGNNGVGGTIVIGTITMGQYFDMPHSPELSLTMTREYGGVKTIEPPGGASLSNSFYNGSPKWGALGAWELGLQADEGYQRQSLSSGGRRIWDLSFNYLQDSDLFPMLSSLSPYESTSDTGEVYSSTADDPSTPGVTETDWETNWHVGNTILDGNTFYNRVIHRTNGGQLPFIFQPDNTNSNPDQFAICKLDMNAFKFEQVANNVYNINLKIREVW